MKHGLEIGRFGLGFKSVLGITQAPQFYSRSGSFCFDEVTSASKIREVIPSAKRFPILRIARPIDALESSAGDPILADLMTWATTVVKLPCDSPEAVIRLSKDIGEFPGEFLLFSSHVGMLLLQDRTTGTLREVCLEHAGDSRVLMVDGKKSRWRLFSSNFRPPDQARRDAGELADREELPVMWAVPMEGRAAAGQFWAFFPTEYKTTLSGIVNAPWKTNEDRQNLLRGDFNSSILDCVANLVVDNLASLSDPEDPGAIVDVLPARKEDAHNWADESLNEAVYSRAHTRPCIPDQEGNLAVPTTLGLPPTGLPRQALEIWASCPGRPVDWCHPSLETRTRRLRVERLVLAGRRSASTVAEWLETLVKHPSPQSSSSAVRAGAAIVLANDPLKRLEVERSKIVLTVDGRLVAPDPLRVFLPSDYISLTADLSIVDPGLATDKEAVAALATFGIKPADVRRELDNLVSTGYEMFRDVDWDRFWMLAELAGQAAPNLIKTAGSTHRIKVRTLSGSFRRIRSTLLPGSIVPEDGSRDSTIAIDRSFHAGTLPLLMKLGAVERPQADLGSHNEQWYHEYWTEALEEYARHLSPTGSKPGFGKLIFDRGDCVGPLEPIYILSDEGCVAFTEAVLSSDDPKWVMLHETRPNNYPQVSRDSPSRWAARRKGKLNTSRGIEPLAECVGSSLSEWAEILPVAQCPSDVAERVGLPQRFIDLSQNQWKAAFDSVQKCTDDSLLGRFYAAAAAVRDDPPTFITCRVGNDHRQVKTLEVHAVAHPHEFQALVLQREPVVLLTTLDEVDLLSSKWGLRHAKTAVRTEVSFAPSGPVIPLLDRFPALRATLTDQQCGLQVTSCTELRLETLTNAGKIPQETDFFIDDSTIYCLDEVSDSELLERIDRSLKLNLSEEIRTLVLGQRANDKYRQALQKIRGAQGLSARLLAAVGAQCIRQRLPAGLLQAVHAEQIQVDDLRLADLAMVVYGIDVLRAFREDLEQAGLEPPSRWAGGAIARKFVRDLGFPKEYAGFEEVRRDPLLEVEGPPNLPELHLFQKKVLVNIQQLINRGGKNRGLLALPTGAGKTRITVQALIELIREKELKGPILWAAQTDELCEQAVQTWSEVWRSSGPRKLLSISRLWASNQAERLDSEIHVIIATIAKLQGCFGRQEYEWLSQATCVVIDEAHAAITPEYTALLEWEGLGRGKDRCPLIGLTATAFRGSSKEETERLVNRFGKHRLDEGIFGDDPYSELQATGVLARVRHEILEGSEIKLTDQELQQLIQTRRFPASAEERLGLDSNRNRVLLDSIRRLPKDWTVLLFATSVDHAQTMAALLSLEGVTAAPISAMTDPSVRRHHIEEFRAGRLRVLTNYNVLAQGFDAPAVRAVYVARPTFSPNLYQQMIGRGLRGPLNGGKEEALIVNVADNVLRYGQELAFRQFEYLWASR
jgi:superfamily II DNA or RNA helicase